MELMDLGWNSYFERLFEPYKPQGLLPLRIIRENKEKYIALGLQGELICEVSGKFRFESTTKSNFPSVGDWVVGTIREEEKKGTIHAILPRQNSFSRKVAGHTTEEQIVAANINTIFIVTGLDLNYNVRRIERFLTLVWNSGATPVILLNKSDLCFDFELKKIEVESIAIGVDVYTISASQNLGLEFLSKYIQIGKTVAFLGSSGVGKSTIINSLLGNNQLKVNEVSEEGSRGKHTTTHRELILLPNGGIVIDTPGMRELQLWGEEEGLKQTFEDIEELAETCRFTDCNHETEPGCAVLEAIQNGTIDLKRLESYHKLKKEFSYLEQRQTMNPTILEKSRSKPISKLIKKYYKDHKNKI